MTAVSTSIEIDTRQQNTLKGEAFYSGIGIHTGAEVKLRFIPAKAGTGIVFRRIDLPNQPEIPALIDYVCDTSRSTTIGIDDVKIHTIEHVLAALKAYNIDNVIIEISNIEPPIANGSSDTFVEMIEKAQVESQDAIIPIAKIKEPIYWANEHVQIIALPYESYRISYTLNYPGSTVLQAQFQTIDITPKNFKNEIAPCRTFSLYNEVSSLMDKGLIKGGSLDNAVVIKDNAILSKEGLYFSNEMARHKILDLIGDLSITGYNFYAHIIAIRSGHATNYQFAKKLTDYLRRELN